MDNEFTEIELKFPLLNPEELVQKLNKIAKPKQKNMFQKDTYYVPAHRNFITEENGQYFRNWFENPYGFSAITDKRSEIGNKVPKNCIIEKASLEDIMVYLNKNNNRRNNDTVN